MLFIKFKPSVPPTPSEMRLLLFARCAKQNITLLYKDKSLTYNVFHKQTKQSEVVIAKDINKTIKAKSAPALHRRTFQISTLENR